MCTQGYNHCSPDVTEDMGQPVSLEEKSSYSDLMIHLNKEFTTCGGP